MSAPLFGCIEAGGTKFVCAVASGPSDIRDRVRIPTTDPDATLDQVLAYFEDAMARHGPITAFGVASFGPLELRPQAPDWGAIRRTPKPGWTGVNIAARLRARFDRPCGVDTDVNGALLAEFRFGAAKDRQVACYVTVGTGIGAGLMVGGTLAHGLAHPEMGHIVPPRPAADRAFQGVCPFHGDCLEGLVSGPAIEKRWGGSLSDLPGDHPGHDIVAGYLGHFASTLIAVCAPERILMGGGVMQTPGLLERVRDRAAEVGGDYLCTRAQLDEILQPPGLGDPVGLLGAFLLAEQVHEVVRRTGGPSE
ncbi:MAG: ROK family protein [Caulobacteraceae bacterium]|nr:ROK family protein [Caulobacteraceae bacterium]